MQTNWSTPLQAEYVIVKGQKHVSRWDVPGSDLEWDMFFLPNHS